MKLWPSTSKPKRNETADLSLFFFFFNVIKSDCRHHWSSLILQFVEYTHKKLKCRQWLLNYLLSGKTAKKSQSIFSKTHLTVTTCCCFGFCVPPSFDPCSQWHLTGPWQDDWWAEPQLCPTFTTIPPSSLGTLVFEWQLWQAFDLIGPQWLQCGHFRSWGLWGT